MKYSPAHLPRTARDLVELIGLPATLRLVEGYGGRTLQIAKGKRSRGAMQLQELGECVGAVAAGKIAARYAGDFLCVPNCKRAILAMRDAELQARFDALTGGGHSARDAVALLAGEFALVESSVWRALKREAGEAGNPQAAVESKQMGLFAA